MSHTSVAPDQVRAGGGDRVQVPERAEGVQLLGEMQGSGYRRPPALVRRADGQTITLTPLLYITLSAIDGRRGTDTIAEALSTAVNRHFTAEDVGYLIDTKLRPLGLVAGPDGAQPVTRKANPLLALRLKFVITNPRLTRRITEPFAGLFRPAIAVPLLLAFVALSWWVLVDKGLASAAHQAFYEPGFILAVWAMIVVSAGFHEFGHAAACRYGGATPGAMGAGLYLVWPAFYTEVSDSYRLGRAGRLRVDLGGLYFNAIFALMTWAVWWVLRWDALLLVVVAQHLQMIRQLAPFIRADGYHIIADLTGVPDLFAHIKPTLMSVLPGRWRKTSGLALKPWARAVVILWVATVVPVLLAVIALGVLLLPRLAATAWDSMGVQWQAATTYWGEGDIAGFTVRALSSLLVALPVAGLVYLLARIGRRTAVSAWRSTNGSPRKRGGALLLLATALAAVAWAWWPADQYEPIDKETDGALPDIIRVEDRRIFIPLVHDREVLRSAPVTSDLGTAPPATGLSEESEHRPPTSKVGSPLLGRVEPGGPDATGTSPDPGVDQSTTRGTWPFPLPEAPAEGDNRAMAVNTTDDSVVTDMAVSWALVTASEVEQQNEAWALASCEDCLTRAVAFQVLLLLDGANVITPLNAAVAANYECTRCTTEAIAVQLVVSITGMPSAEAQALIDEAIGKVERLEADLHTLSADQVYYVLQASQAEIMQILRDDGVIPTAEISDAAMASETAADSPTEADETASAGPSPTQPPSPSDTTTGENTTEAGTTDGSPASEPIAEEPSSDPTREPTSEPTSEPTATESSEPSPEPTSEPSP